MKHIVRTLLVIVIYIFLAGAGINTFLPMGEIEYNVMARDDQGNIYGVKSSRFFMYVYKMDSDGNPIGVYRCRSENKEAESMCRYTDGALYVGQVWFEDDIQKCSIWKKADTESGFTKVWEKDLEDEVNISDFYVENNTMYIVGIRWGSRDVVVYSHDEKGNFKDYKIDGNSEVVNACWGNGGLYILTQDDEVYFSNLEGSKSNVNIVDNAVMLMTDESGIYYRQKDSESLEYVSYKGLVRNTYNGLGDVWYVVKSDWDEGNIAVLTYKDGGDCLLLVSLDGTEVSEVKGFQLSFWEGVKKSLLPVLIITLCYVAAVILIYLFKKLVWNQNKLRYQTMAVVASISIIWLVAMLVVIYAMEEKNEYADVLNYTEICSEIQSGRVEDEASISELDYENYIGSTQQSVINRLFGNDAIGSAWQEQYASQEIVYGYENPEFVFSEVAAYGRRVDTYYGSNVIKLIRNCLENNEVVCIVDKVSERQYVICATPIGNTKQQLCLLVRMPLHGLGNHGNLGSLYAVSIVGWFAMMIFLRIFLKRKWDFMGAIVTRMERVSRGDYKSEEKLVPANEFGNMWTSLERMCKNIQLQRYKHDGTLEYVSQFAPKNFERLFGKERLQDVEVGEVLQISATVGIISIIDRDTLLSGKLQRQYVHYVNKLMEILFSQEQSGKAIFLQDGSNLETVKVIFKEEENSTATAVRYSIDCIETLLGLTEIKYDTKPFIMLHTSTFNCGIAGGSRQVYPFATSTELETLSTYISPLKSCGVRMAVTGSTWGEIRDKVRGRYIGYVISNDKDISFKLYEILDVCSQPQELGRLKNKDNFDKALSLFYKNELYEARNMFSDIVKECPDDGIARWYAFACDELYNREEGAPAHYELFWTMF